MCAFNSHSRHNISHFRHTHYNMMVQMGELVWYWCVCVVFVMVGVGMGEIYGCGNDLCDSACVTRKGSDG